jgi:protein-tyrosine phosphatase
MPNEPISCPNCGASEVRQSAPDSYVCGEIKGVGSLFHRLPTPLPCGKPHRGMAGAAEDSGRQGRWPGWLSALTASPRRLLGLGVRRIRGIMLDLHCHILPGIDDGAASLEEALAMARFSVQDGITHIAATPHCHRYTRLLRADILPHVVRLNDELVRAGVPLTILPGSEVQVTDTAAYRRDCEAGLYCHLGDGHAFTLLEFNWKDEFYPPDAPELVGWLRGRGMTPIVAHPERHGFFGQDPGRLRALVEAGAWLQVTVDSLLGNHGPAPQASGEELLRTYPEAVLATDAHNLRRCSGLSAGFAWVRDRLGVQRAEELRLRAEWVLSVLLGGAPLFAPAQGGEAG